MAINANTVWEFRTSGSNDNSGGFKAGGTGTDYSQQDAAQLTLSDLATDGAGTGLSSATGGFTAAMVDNIIYIKSGTGFTVGWYEITAYTDTNNVTIDRSAGASATSGAGSVGGARALPTDAWIEMTVDGNHSHFKSGTYTFTETVSNSDAGSSSLSHVYEGYLATRGDAPTGDDRPLFATGAYSFWINGTAWMYNIRVTTTSLRALYNNLASNVSYVNCSGINTSGTASRYGIDAFGTNAKVYHCEGVSANGIALRVSTDAIVVKSEFRDSVTGGSLDGNYNRFCSNIFDTISGTAIDVATRQGSLASNNTFYNVATGISITTGSRNDIINNIFHTCTTVGVVCNSDKKTVNNLYGNMWYHNTADTTNAIKSGSAIDADPEFVNAAAGDFTVGSNAEVSATTPSGRTSLTTTKGAIPAAGGGSGGAFHFSNRFNPIGDQ